jgi:hypothetical protein
MISEYRRHYLIVTPALLFVTNVINDLISKLRNLGPISRVGSFSTSSRFAVGRIARKGVKITHRACRVSAQKSTSADKFAKCRKQSVSFAAMGAQASCGQHDFVSPPRNPDGAFDKNAYREHASQSKIAASFRVERRGYRNQLGARRHVHASEL